MNRERLLAERANLERQLFSSLTEVDYAAVVEAAQFAEEGREDEARYALYEVLSRPFDGADWTPGPDRLWRIGAHFTALRQRAEKLIIPPPNSLATRSLVLRASARWLPDLLYESYQLGLLARAPSGSRKVVVRCPACADDPDIDGASLPLDRLCAPGKIAPPFRESCRCSLRFVDGGPEDRDQRDLSRTAEADRQRLADFFAEMHRAKDESAKVASLASATALDAANNARFALSSASSAHEKSEIALCQSEKALETAEKRVNELVEAAARASEALEIARAAAEQADLGAQVASRAEKTAQEAQNLAGEAEKSAEQAISLAQKTSSDLQNAVNSVSDRLSEALRGVYEEISDFADAHVSDVDGILDEIAQLKPQEGRLLEHLAVLRARQEQTERELTGLAALAESLPRRSDVRDAVKAQLRRFPQFAREESVAQLREAVARLQIAPAPEPQGVAPAQVRTQELGSLRAPVGLPKEASVLAVDPSGQMYFIALPEMQGTPFVVVAPSGSPAEAGTGPQLLFNSPIIGSQYLGIF